MPVMEFASTVYYPGGTKTAMANDAPQTHEFIANLHPMKRMAEPEEIANAAHFLLSDS